MTETLRLFMLAGEASGDRIGADLVQRLRGLAPVSLSGVGGPELASEGLVSLFPMADLSVMGVSDVLRRLPLLLLRMHQVAQAIIRHRPDVVVLIDSQEFSRLVARRVRRSGGRVPLMLYVSPSVWAWRPQRAKELAPLFDEILAILPFEPRVMKELGGPTTSFVGHPAVARKQSRATQPERGPLLLLPGSRQGELRRHLPLMRSVAERLAQHPRLTGFVMPTLPTLVEQLRQEVSDWPVPVQVVAGPQREAAFDGAYAAFAVSGTITFELAMAGVPMVITYVADRHQASGFLKLEIEMIGLPNIIAGRAIVPEVLSARPEPLRAEAVLRSLLDDPAAVAAQRQCFLDLRALMERGAPEAPLADPAQRVLAHWPQREAMGS